MGLRNNSLIHAAASWLAGKASGSCSFKRFDDFCGRRDPAEDSVYGRLLRLIERLLTALGAYIRESLFYAALTGIKEFYFRITENSLIFAAVNRIPLHRWMLIAFSFYLPIDWVLRDLLPAGVFASIWDEMFMAVAAILVLWRSCLGQRPGSFSRSSSVGTVLLLYIAVMIMLMAITRPRPDIALAGLRAQVQYALWFFIILRLIDDLEDIRTVMFCFAALVFVMSLHGIYQFIAAVPIPKAWVTATESAVRTRVFSIVGSPNIFGTLLVLAVPIPAALIYYLKKPLHKFLALCAAGAMCLCELFTFSKASWGALAITVVIFALFVDRRLLLALSGAVAALLVAVPSIANRLTFIFSEEYRVASSVGGRALRWATGKELLESSSNWFGFGLGRFGGAVAMNNQVIDTSDGFKYFYMDNYYLKTMVEAGYIGLGAFILLLSVFIISGIKILHNAGRGSRADKTVDELFRNTGDDRLLLVGVFSGMCGVLFHCYFENIFEEPYMMAYFWGLAAVLISFRFVKEDG